MEHARGPPAPLPAACSHPPTVRSPAAGAPDQGTDGMALLADAALLAEDEPAELEAAGGGPPAASASVAGREEVRQ